MIQNRTIKFIVEGQAVGKQRPKAAIIGGHARVYTPAKTINYESLVRDAYKKASDGIVLEGEIHAEIVIAYQLEKRHYLKKGINKEGLLKLSHEINPTKKPDIDNVVKSIFDALNSVAYKDDSQINNVSITKIYEEMPFVSVSLTDFLLPESVSKIDKK